MFQGEPTSCLRSIRLYTLLYTPTIGVQAPVPFIVGVQYKTDEVRSLCGGLVRVNMYKDQVSESLLSAACRQDY